MSTPSAEFLKHTRESLCQPESLSQLFPIVGALLRQHLVRLVGIHYTGAYDVRHVREPVWVAEPGANCSEPIPAEVWQEVRVFFSEFLELRHPGWANAEGSRGYFLWNVERNELAHFHELRSIGDERTQVRGL